jgi:hypothetical protein
MPPQLIDFTQEVATGERIGPSLEHGTNISAGDKRSPDQIVGCALRLIRIFGAE